ADGRATEGGGYISNGQPLTQPGEQDQYHGKADRRAQAVGGGLEEGLLGPVGVQQRHAEYGAVGSDQRQEDAQYAIQQRAGLVHHHLGELHDHGDHQDEGNGAQEFQLEGQQDVLVGQVTENGGQGQHEGGGHGHADGRLQLAGNTHERTQPEKLHQ